MTPEVVLLDPSEALFVDDQVAFLDGAAAMGIETRRIVRERRVGVPGMPPGNGEHPSIKSLADVLV